MRSSVIITLLLSAFWLPLQAQVGQKDSSSTSVHPVYTVVEQQPEFPGGMSKLSQYIETNLKYPKIAQEAKLAGRVFIRFVITREGTIEKVQVLKGVSPEIDAEAVRLVEKMPNWIPGKTNGQAVNCQYNLPINFSLD